MMFKRLFALILAVAMAVSTCQVGVRAVDWPARNLNQTLNRQIIDPSVLNSAATPFSLDVYRNTIDMVAGGGYFYYSDGDIQSTIYAISLSSHQAVWSKQFPKQVSRLIWENGRLYFGADKGYCLNGSTGAEIWSADPGKYNGVDNYNVAIHQIDDNNLYGFRFYGTSFRLIILNKSTGTISLTSHSYSDRVNEIAIWNGKLYISYGRGGPYAYGKIGSYDLSTFVALQR